MLLITPRTFFVGGVGGGVGLLSRRGMISGSQGGASIIGVGSRPWLQKVAALTVAISLTIATADTFGVAERQYALGVMDADDLRIEVANSIQIKISRVISDIFLWLAQVQTLIRLFPRHKEKVLIKWIGFALIVLDTTFSCLNSFSPLASPQQKKLGAAIPALSYLFQLALSLLYASWVLYYVLCKRRYAFYHNLMWNVSIVALLSIVAIATPVVFFITDLANPSIAGWGDYFRWVGAAGASVIVWEWVERIEALEREEKKDGILGTEVFDGDDSDDSLYGDRLRRRRRRFWTGQHAGTDDTGVYASGVSTTSQSGNFTAPREGQRLLNSLSSPNIEAEPINPVINNTENPITTLIAPTPPPQTISPISRSDTASAASTVYTVQYNTLNLATPPVFRPNPPMQRNRMVPTEQDIPESNAAISEKEYRGNESILRRRPESSHEKGLFIGLRNPFKPRKAEPPAEVKQGQVIDPVPLTEPTRQQPIHNYAAWDLKGRLGAFAAEKGEKLREWGSSQHQKEDDLPVTIIPAQRRPGGRQPWSPINSENDAAQVSPMSNAALLAPETRRETSESSIHDGSISGVHSESVASPRVSFSPPQQMDSQGNPTGNQ
jgi:PalH/RIM21